MPRDFLQGAKTHYDVVVIGSGLGGLTAANLLGRSGRSVLVVEQHYKLGGLATWFKRPGGHIFDISLHGFPYGMVKSCRRYWTQEIAERIYQLKRIRFDNPDFSLTTTFDRADFQSLLVSQFKVKERRVREFFEFVGGMNFFDDRSTTTGELMEQFFPGRPDVVRLLMEPITYANGSTLEDPAISYGIVFSNFMSKGVWTFSGGTDRLIGAMCDELRRNGVDLRIRCDAQRVYVEGGRVVAVKVNERTIGTDAVVSNANLRRTIFELVGENQLTPQYAAEAGRVRLNNSSAQVYLALKPQHGIDPQTGDVLFSSTAPRYCTESLLSPQVSSRTFSFYYPQTRPNRKHRCFVVSSTNARYQDWAELGPVQYQVEKARLVESTIAAASRYVPDFASRVEFAEASTPVTFEHYTRHLHGASFGTKFEGLAVSRGLPRQVAGMYHAGSCGIIMSGWLGTINYGVIVANDVDNYLLSQSASGVAHAS